jgi:hypothetical protein
MKTVASNSLDCYQGLEPAQAGQSTRTAGPERGWAVYAAAAGSALAMSGAADADIIYSGVQNVTVEEGGTLSALIDVDGGGADLKIFLNLGIDKGSALVSGSNGAQLANVGIYFSARRFASGSTISSGAGFRTNSMFVLGENKKGSAVGEWEFSTNGIAGFKLGSGNFGWIRLHVENTDSDVYPDRMTAIDWAYEDSGAAIAAGATGSAAPAPAPASLALLATGAVGVAAMRRRRRARHGAASWLATTAR